jgi:hypothetical protein
MNEIGPEENDEDGKGDAKGKRERCATGRMAGRSTRRKVTGRNGPDE